MEFIPHDFSGKTIRIKTDDKGDPWWIAADVCYALGISNSRDAVSILEDDEKDHMSAKLDGWSQARKVSIINKRRLRWTLKIKEKQFIMPKQPLKKRWICLGRKPA